MALAIVILIFILMLRLGGKGRAYRERKSRERSAQRKIPKGDVVDYMRAQREKEYREKLKDEGFTDEIITVVLPTIMNDKQ